MNEHFNNLTPAEAERLALLSEEMAEVQKCICKILRHGYESYNPTIHASPSNRNDLAIEIGHVEYAISLLCNNADVDGARVSLGSHQKAKNVVRWLHHQ